MAHIQKRGNGRWRARYRGSDNREHSRTFTRKADAERFRASVESRKNLGEWINPQLGLATRNRIPLLPSPAPPEELEDFFEVCDRAGLKTMATVTGCTATR